MFVKKSVLKNILLKLFLKEICGLYVIENKYLFLPKKYL